MTLFERQLLGPVARERNRFIKAAASDYQKHGGVPRHQILTHAGKLQILLSSHYAAVLPYFGNMVGHQFKSRRKPLEIKRLSFLSHMQEWTRTRALESASTISDTDYSDVQNAIDRGITDGLGVEEIAGNISDVTGLTAFRAATVARTETHAAATYGAMEEARQTSNEIGIVLMKEWLPTLDDRTRPEHAAMDGSEPIPMEDKFLVGGEEMDRPGDPSASAENTINCRCCILVTEAQE
jgi:uncharacterized protein with gpF-like domain